MIDFIEVGNKKITHWRHWPDKLSIGARNVARHKGNYQGCEKIGEKDPRTEDMVKGTIR